MTSSQVISAATTHISSGSSSSSRSTRRDPRRPRRRSRATSWPLPMRPSAERRLLVVPRRPRVDRRAVRASPSLSTSESMSPAAFERGAAQFGSGQRRRSPCRRSLRPRISDRVGPGATRTGCRPGRRAAGSPVSPMSPTVHSGLPSARVELEAAGRPPERWRASAALARTDRRRRRRARRWRRSAAPARCGRSGFRSRSRSRAA